MEIFYNILLITTCLFLSFISPHAYNIDFSRDENIRRGFYIVAASLTAYTTLHLLYNAPPLSFYIISLAVITTAGTLCHMLAIKIAYNKRAKQAQKLIKQLDNKLPEHEKVAIQKEAKEILDQLRYPH